MCVSPCVCACTWIFKCLCTCVHERSSVCVLMCAHEYGIQKSTWGVFPNHSPSEISIGRVSCLSSELTSSASLGSQLVPGTLCLCLPRMKLQVGHHGRQTLVWVLGILSLVPSTRSHLLRPKYGCVLIQQNNDLRWVLGKSLWGIFHCIDMSPAGKSVESLRAANFFFFMNNDIYFNCFIV